MNHCAAFPSSFDKTSGTLENRNSLLVQNGHAIQELLHVLILARRRYRNLQISRFRTYRKLKSPTLGLSGTEKSLRNLTIEARARTTRTDEGEMERRVGGSSAKSQIIDRNRAFAPGVYQPPLRKHAVGFIRHCSHAVPRVIST